MIKIAPGSSPLARGLLGDVGYLIARQGIIPARAGFTAPRARSQPPPGDHPRSRGVYYCGGGEVTEEKGSSPLARGLRRCESLVDRLRRIIPARAGFTTRSASCLSRLAGSSPLARGLQTNLLQDARLARIIPARAGFTLVSCPLAGRQWDHPRSRGVYCRRICPARMLLGSSPLARGLRRDHTTTQSSAADHPRSRGVYFPLRQEIGVDTGSSPLARGLPFQAGGRPVQSGIIPARAGFTAAFA